MKKINSTILFIATMACVALISSCTKKNDDGGSDSDVKYAEIDATIEQSISGVKSEWQTGNEVSLFYTDSYDNHEFILTSNSGANGHFRGVTDTEGDEYVAIHPYSADNVKLSAGYTCFIPSIQYATSGTYDTKALVMVASAKKGETASFKNICALLKFTAGEDIQSFSIASNNGEKIAGTTNVQITADGTVTSSTTGTSTIVLRNTISKGSTYYIVIAPATLTKGMTISATMNGKLYTKAINDKQYTFSRNTVTDLGTISMEGSTEVSNEAVDLGLPSKTLWAPINLGATSAVDPGLYFQWGDTNGYTRNSGHLFTKDTYKFGDETVSTSKYNATDKKATLDEEDDAASINWGEDWSMPSQKQCQELISNCYFLWTTNYNGTGISGYIVYKAKDTADKGKLENSILSASVKGSYSLNDTHIFLPVTGYFSDDNKSIIHEEDGFYWANSIYNEDYAQAVRMYIYDGKGIINQGIGAEASSGYYRHTGRCIRPVRISK